MNLGNNTFFNCILCFSKLRDVFFCVIVWILVFLYSGIIKRTRKVNGGLLANRQKDGQTVFNDASNSESSLSNIHQTIFINNHQKQFKKQRLKNQ